MKKVFLAMFAATLSFGAFAQDTTSTKTASPTEQQPQQQKDMYVFKNSKMWNVKNGNVTAMSNDVTLSDGTVVKPSGEITKNGKTEALKDGQFIDADGKIGETTEK